MSSEQLKSIVLPILLSGLRGSSVPSVAGVTTDLQALALTAQALRFDRPARPEQFNTEENVAEARRIVAPEIREKVVSLLGNQHGDQTIHRALAEALAANRLRLHPFDLEKFESFVATYADDLGAEAVAYSQRNVVGERRQSYFAPEVVSDDTWMFGNRGEKAKYIARLRAENSGHARQLVEDVWSTQDVDSRVRLAGALRVGASSQDKPFLTTLLKDRSSRVRDVARGVLVRLPDFEGDDGHLKSIKSRIRLKEYGLPLMRRKEMRLDLPSTVGYYGAASWVQENFGKIDLDEFAGSYELSVDEILTAASVDANVMHGILVMAVCSGASQTAGRIVGEYLQDEGSSFVSIDPSIYEHLAQGEKDALASAVLKPEAWSYISVQLMERIYGLIEGQMSEDLMQRILFSRGWRAMVIDTSRMSIDVINYLAVMCPPSARESFLKRLSTLDSHWTAEAILFLQIIENLESSNV